MISFFIAQHPRERLMFRLAHLDGQIFPTRAGGANSASSKSIFRVRRRTKKIDAFDLKRIVPLSSQPWHNGATAAAAAAIRQRQICRRQCLIIFFIETRGRIAKILMPATLRCRSGEMPGFGPRLPTNRIFSKIRGCGIIWFAWNRIYQIIETIWRYKHAHRTGVGGWLFLSLRDDTHRHRKKTHRTGRSTRPLTG